MRGHMKAGSYPRDDTHLVRQKTSTARFSRSLWFRLVPRPIEWRGLRRTGSLRDIVPARVQRHGKAEDRWAHEGRTRSARTGTKLGVGR
jgi:hypothetical protein